MSLAGVRLLARRCPAYRRREPDLRHSRGTGEGAPGVVRRRTGSSSGEGPVMGLERRGRVVRGCVRSINRTCSGRSRVGELKAPGKSFEISKWAVWEAWEKVKANKGAPGVDGQSVAEFEKDLKGNLYKIWSASSRTGGEAVISCS
jgi:hypothetical protein